jgi:hypothetical protein
VRRLIVLSAALLTLIGLSAGLRAADKGDDDTPAAKKTRELLQTKITCDYTDTTGPEILDDLKDQVKGLNLIFKKGDLGIKRNHNFTYKAKDVTVADALDKILGPMNWGYIVISQKGAAYDGLVEIRSESKERGFPADKDK